MRAFQTMFRSFLLALVVVGPTLCPSLLNGAGSSAYFGHSGIESTAVDAKGVRHRQDRRLRELPPWIQDRIKAFAPDYPRADRAKRNEGTGLFRLTLDLETGAVTRITMLKSTGFVTLDRCAIASFRHWRWKPGKWKEIEMPITFKMGSRPSPLPPGAVRIPTLGR
jgi:TonB family protein